MPVKNYILLINSAIFIFEHGNWPGIYGRICIPDYPICVIFIQIWRNIGHYTAQGAKNPYTGVPASKGR